MNRDEALGLVKKKIVTKNLVKHVLAAEAVMARLAQRLGEDAVLWALAGLLHDIDYETTKNNPARHSLEGGALLEKLGADPSVVQAVRAHNGAHGIPRVSLLDKALYAVDPLTGLIVAAALIHPARKLAALDVPFVMNRFGEKHFAKGANRETIRTCSEFGMELEEFISAGLSAMQEIAPAIGL